MSKKRLALLTFSYPRFKEDESSVFIRKLVEGYAEAGAEGLVIVPHDRGEPLQESHGSFSIQRYKYGLFVRGKLAFGSGIMPNLRKNPLLAFQIPLFLLCMYRQALLHRNQYDAIHANWLVTGLVALMAKITLRKPYILTLRGEDMRLLEKRLFRRIFQPVLMCARQVTSVNSDFVAKVTAYYPGLNPKCLTIHNGVEIPELEPVKIQEILREYSLTKESFLISVGTLIPRKRVEWIIDVLPLLPDYELVLCGRLTHTQYVDGLKRQLSDLGLQDRVRFLGPVPPEHIPYLLSQAKCLVSASSFEGRPNAVLEAMAVKTPVLLSNIPAHSEILKDQSYGLLFDTNDTNSFAERMIHLETEYSSETLEAAYLEVSSQSWKSCAESYLKCF